MDGLNGLQRMGDSFNVLLFMLDECAFGGGGRRQVQFIRILGDGSNTVEARKR